MTEYWIWSNEHRAWWGHAERGYVQLLRDAGRYSQQKAEDIVYHANRFLPDNSFPNEVAIPVVNGYMSKRGRRILDDFEKVETLEEWTPRDDLRDMCCGVLNTYQHFATVHKQDHP